jgi:hypothetical protein
MESKEIDAFVELLMAYRRLWVNYETLKYMQNHPDANAKKVKDRFLASVEKALLPVTGALLAGTALEASLQAALRTLPPR